MEELFFGVPTILAAGMLSAGETDMLREAITHSFPGIALRDPLVASDLEQTMRDSVYSWQSPDGYYFWGAEALMLQMRALVAVIDDGEVDVEGLRAWLPRPEELLYRGEHELLFFCNLSGASHPALLCATLYGTRLNAWDDAEAIVPDLLRRHPTSYQTPTSDPSPLPFFLLLLLSLSLFLSLRHSCRHSAHSLSIQERTA